MKKDIFERFIDEQLSEGRSSEDIISEIEESISNLGCFSLSDVDGTEVKLQSVWLANFGYKVFIANKESERYL